ncbi:MAG TPA: two-component regulator propeller domain-containing protein [Edaphocola sp.]|nr:two-component regulator propeller domain-containing protein [Edaphocola sp.]
MKKPAALNKILCRISLSVFLLLIFPSGASADIQVLTSKDGLSENQITAVAKDKTGRIWIGTTNGLNVYDGYSVHRIQDKILTNANITDLAFDTTRNIIWVGTINGLFGVQTLSMRPLRPTWDQSVKARHNTSPHAVIKIILQASGKSNTPLIIFENGQTALLDGNTLHALLQLPSAGVSSCSAGRFPDGDIFLFINKKNYRLNVSSRSLTSLPSFESNNFYVNRISQYDKDRLLVVTFNKGLYLYNMSTHQITVPGFLKGFNSHNRRNMLAAVIKNGTIYVAMDNYHFSNIPITGNRYRNISSQYKTVFEGRQYNCIFIDNQNTVWLGTNKGLIKLPNEKRLFRKALQSDPNNVSTRNIIQAGNKDIYVASYNGLYQYSSRNKRWQLYRKSDMPKDAASTIEKDRSLYKYDVQPYALMLDQEQQNILIGMEGTQILRFNIQDRQFFNLKYRFRSDSQHLQGIFCFAQIPSGEIKAASNIGLISFRPSSGNTLEFSLFNKFFQGQNTGIHTVSFSRLRKKIILGTTNGLFILDTNQQIQAHFSTTTTPRLSNNDVLCFLEDEKGNIWAGTNGGGVNKISADLKSVTNINSEKGLSNDIIYGILSDNNQKLWISTFDGLNRYDPRNDGIRCYYKEQGLPTDEFNRHSSLKAADGTLYFGSINGIVSFNPSHLEAALPPFKIFLSGITKWDAKQKSLKYDMALPLDKDGRLTVIKHKNDLITDLHFGCSDYSVIAKNKFQYRIKGITKDWTSITGSNSFNINGLPFGKFRLEVRAINYRGQISRNTLMIDINNVKPLYQLWWFYALILLMVSGIIYSVFTFRLHKYKSSVQLRMRIASSLHDEVGSILTRITMIAESLSLIEKSNINKMQGKLAKLAALSREATASMSDVLWAVDSRNDFSGSLTDRMREHAEEMFSAPGIDLIFDFSGSNHDTRLPQVLRKELYLIYKEALHNIVKHAPKATFIHIEFHFQPNSFHLLITNDGADIQWKEYGTGQGLKNIYKRAKAITAHCRIFRNENNHTFSVKIFK